MTAPYGDPDDLAWFGSGSRPDTGELSDPLARIGRLTPLDVKLQGAYQGQPVGDAMIAVGNAAVGLGAIPPDALSATVQVQANAVRFTFTGTTPTSVVGTRADAGTVLTIAGRESLMGFLVIQEGVGGATLAVTYWT